MLTLHRVHTEPGKPGKWGIFTKTQEEPGIVREFSIAFIQVRDKSGKTKYLVHMSISLTLSKAVCKVVVPFVVSKCELYHVA